MNTSRCVPLADPERRKSEPGMRRLDQWIVWIGERDAARIGHRTEPGDLGRTWL